MAYVSDASSLPATDAPTIAFWTPVLLSLLSGLATSIGGLIVLTGRFTSDAAISASLAFAAGVMTSVSVLDLWLPLASVSLDAAAWATLYMLIGGGLTKLLLLHLPIPDPETVATDLWRGIGITGVSSTCLDGGVKQHAASKRVSAWRLGFVLAIVLTIHNAPEGILVGVGAIKSPQLGLTLCAAIFMHNIAEGFVVAVPTLAGTGSKRAALMLTFISGMSEPLGAAVGVLFMRTWFSTVLEAAINVVLCGVGGIMIGVSLLELLPQAVRFGISAHGADLTRVYTRVAAAFITGGVVMAVTMLLV